MSIDRRSFLTAVALAPAALAQTQRDWSGQQPVRYADPDVIALDKRWLEEDGHVSVFRSPSEYSNGNTSDFEGRQVSCQHGLRRVVRFEPDGAPTVIADKWQGKPLNSPNDLVVNPDGAVWFTDPPYGILGYYVADGKSLRNKRQFTNMTIPGKGAGSADGIRADTDGNIWTGAGWGGAGYDGVHVFTPAGERIGMIVLPEACANVCFGGSKRNRLFMAASQSLYAVYVGTRGAHIA